MRIKDYVKDRIEILRKKWIEALCKTFGHKWYYFKKAGLKLNRDDRVCDRCFKAQIKTSSYPVWRKPFTLSNLNTKGFIMDGKDDCVKEIEEDKHPLHDENESDTFYYYLRDMRHRKGKKGRPVVTVCLIVDKNRRVIVRGVSICSLKDNPCKKTGRRIARNRALWAAVNPNRSNPIARREACTVLFRAGRFSSNMDKASYVSLDDLSLKERGILFPKDHPFHKEHKWKP